MFQDGQEVELQAARPALWLVPKVLNSCCQKSWKSIHSEEMREIVASIIGRLTNLHRPLYHVRRPEFAKHSLSLWPEFCHTSSCSMKSLLRLCPNRAVWLEYALPYAMVKNLAGSYFGFLYRKRFYLLSQGERGFFLYKKCWLELVVDWSVGVVEGKDVSWLGRNRSVRLGTSWYMFL